MSALGIAAAILLAAAPAAALDDIPVVRVNGAGGQVFFKDYAGTSKSLTGSASGTADWLFADGLRLSDDDTLIPTLSGQYLRRDQVDQVGGGGTLVSETLDDDGSVRWVHSFGAWAVKPNIGYKSELAVSLTGESLSRGIFDFRQMETGVELEWKGDAVKSVRQTLSASKTQYYHYRHEFGVSPLFGVELHQANRNLDFNSYAYTAALDLIPWQDGLLSGSVGGSLAAYGDQPVVDQDPVKPGAFVLSSAKRRDWVANVLLGLTQKWTWTSFGLPFDASAGVTAGYVALVSNQNDFDLNQSFSTALRFNSDYYGYREGSAASLVTLGVGPRWRGTFSYNYARRQYALRPVQDSLGNYQPGRVWTDTHSVGYGVSYQPAKHLVVRASGGYVYARSNTHFESFYLYNYSYPYYFLGFGYSL